jgi:hypothetical protein
VIINAVECEFCISIVDAECVFEPIISWYKIL